MKLLVAALLAMAAVVFAPVAHAGDFDIFLEELDQEGFPVSAEDDRMKAVILGLTVCVDLFKGIDETDEVDDLIGIGMTRTQANAMFDAATYHLCPGAVRVSAR